MTKQRYFTLAILLIITVLVAAAVPLALSARQESAQAQPNFTSRPTGTQLSTPAAVIPDTSGRAEPEASAVEIGNCTYPLAYWRMQPNAWPAEILLGGVVYTKPEVNVLLWDEDPDPAIMLKRQVYTAFLNVLYGADLASIESTLVDAAQWLDDNPQGGTYSQLTRDQGDYLVQILELYNNGEIGPGACEYTLPEPAAAATAIGPVLAATNLPAALPQSLGPVWQPAPPVNNPNPPQNPAPTDMPPPPPTSIPPTAVPPTSIPPIPIPPTSIPPTSVPPTTVPPTAVPPTPVPPTPVLPTTVPPTPAPTSPPAGSAPSCPGANIHPKGQQLADDFNVSYEEIMGWNCQGFGFGDIQKAYELSEETGTPVAEIFALRASGLGWGEIKKRLSP